MPTINRKSNPTKLIDIDRNKVTIFQASAEQGHTFALTRLDVEALGLSPDLQVVCIARTQNASQRFVLGPLHDWDRTPQLLNELRPDSLPVYRVLLRKKEDPRIVASAENLRPAQHGSSDSFLPVLCEDLEHELWKVKIEAGTAPVLLVNSQVFSTPGEALAIPYFSCLVLPQVVRQIVGSIAAQRAFTEDPSDWAYPWCDWLRQNGIEIPEDLDPDEPDAALKVEEFVDLAAHHFCRAYDFAEQFKQLFQEGAGD